MSRGVGRLRWARQKGLYRRLVERLLLRCRRWFSIWYSYWCMTIRQELSGVEHGCSVKLGAVQDWYGPVVLAIRTSVGMWRRRFILIELHLSSIIEVRISLCRSPEAAARFLLVLLIQLIYVEVDLIYVQLSPILWWWALPYAWARVLCDGCAGAAVPGVIRSGAF